jgi:hypothetical protein
MSGNYTFGSSSATYLYGYLYNNSFVATNPSQNLITFAFDSNQVPNFALTTALSTGIVYILVMTTRDPNATGSFTITASGIGNTVFVPPVTTTRTTTTTTAGTGTTTTRTTRTKTTTTTGTVTVATTTGEFV